MSYDIFNSGFSLSLFHKAVTGEKHRWQLLFPVSPISSTEACNSFIGHQSLGGLSLQCPPCMATWGHPSLGTLTIILFPCLNFWWFYWTPRARANQWLVSITCLVLFNILFSFRFGNKTDNQKLDFPYWNLESVENLWCTNCMHFTFILTKMN